MAQVVQLPQIALLYVPLSGSTVVKVAQVAVTIISLALYVALVPLSCSTVGQVAQIGHLCHCGTSSADYYIFSAICATCATWPHIQFAPYYTSVAQVAHIAIKI